MDDSKNIHLFTSNFPFGNSSEIAFINLELDYLSKRFNKVFIYPYNENLSIESEVELPRNVEVVSIKPKNGNLLSLSDKKLIFFLILKEVYLHPSLLLKKKVAYLYALLKSYSVKAKAFDVNRKRNSNVNFDTDIFYTYWFENWNCVLSLWKVKYAGDKPFLISRAHGFDLFDYRNELGFLPFRKLQLKNTDNIFSISITGAEYLKDKFSSFGDKISCHRLGVYNKGVNINSNNIRIISCSSIVKVKRVHLIVEILKHVKKKVDWVHFGDGELREELLQSVKELPANISFDFRGNVPNQKLIDYYKSYSVSVFINVSESEGIPVSVMEAISFGIPVIATNVGGESEIVTEKTGILIEKKFNPIDVAEIINLFPKYKLCTNEFRSGTVTFWNEHYNAEKNINAFIQSIGDR